MKPLAPAEYAALQFATSPVSVTATSPADDTDRSLAAAGLLVLSDVVEPDGRWTWVEATESGHRALRVHATYLASVGGGS